MSNNPTIALIKHIAGAVHVVTVAQIEGPERVTDVLHARYAAMGIMKEYYPHMSLKAIAKHFSNRDHTTVINALERYKLLNVEGSDFAQKVASIKQRLNK